MDTSSPQPLVQAIIVTWNKKTDVLALLAQLKRIRYPAERLAILVVDNASTDGTVRAIETAHPDITLIQHKENRGGAGGFNAGMRWTLANRPQTDYLWLLDNDVCVDANALNVLVQVMQDRPRAAVCGSKIMDLEQRNSLIEIGAFIDYRSGDVRRNEPDAERLKDPRAVFEVDYVAACSLLARVEAVKRVGIWHEAFFIYWDDMEWGARFNAAGYDVLAANGSVVYHPSWAGRTADQSAVWRNYYRSRNSLWFFDQYQTGLRRRLLRCKLVNRYLLFAAHAAVNASGGISRAFVRGIEDFFNADFGKKDFFLNATSVVDALQALALTDVMLFVADAAAEAQAKSFVTEMAERCPGVGIRCILPERFGQAWRKADCVKDLLLYARTKKGGLTLACRYRMLRFLGRHPWQMLVSSPQTPKLATIWGRPVARIDFASGKTLFIDRMILKEVFRILLRWPALMLRALFGHKDPTRRDPFFRMRRVAPGFHPSPGPFPSIPVSRDTR